MAGLLNLLGFHRFLFGDFEKHEAIVYSDLKGMPGMIEDFNFSGDWIARLEMGM